MTSARESLQRLKSGNERFVRGETEYKVMPYADRDLASMKTPSPFAVIVSCSDSRVPVERLFDQCIGNLFIIRIAGIVVARTQLGSIEFGVDKLGARLIVVLGHSDCAAVGATLDGLDNPSSSGSENLDFLVEQIGPNLAELIAANRDLSKKQILKLAIRANVRASMQELESRSPCLREHLQQGDLEIVGAEYSLETGTVAFLNA